MLLMGFFPFYNACKLISFFWVAGFYDSLKYGRSFVIYSSSARYKVTVMGPGKCTAEMVLLAICKVSPGSSISEIKCGPGYCRTPDWFGKLKNFDSVPLPLFLIKRNWWIVFLSKFQATAYTHDLTGTVASEPFPFAET
jgi:hypothetical protein